MFAIEEFPNEYCMTKSDYAKLGSMYETLKVANYFVVKGIEDGDPVTLMKLIKLLYFAQGLAFAFLDRPLFTEDFQAWRYGPVLPSLYHLAKTYGAKRIKDPLLGDFQEVYHPHEFDEDDEKILRAVWRKWGKEDGLSLSKITHAPGSPWEKIWKQYPGQNKPIEQSSISEYFKQVYQK